MTRWGDSGSAEHQPTYLADQDSAALREHMAALFEAMIAHTFRGGDCFDHLHMSAGEGLAALLGRLDAVDEDGAILTLAIPMAGIAEACRTRHAADLPLPVDVLDGALRVLAQYGAVPHIADPARALDFAHRILTILRAMGLVDTDGVATAAFVPVLVNHHMLVPGADGWHPVVHDALLRLCLHTRDTAPEGFLALFGAADHPTHRAEAALRRHWPHGRWLTPPEAARSIDNGHPALPGLVARTLADPGGGVWTPPQRHAPPA